MSTSMSKPSYYENMRFKPCLRQKYLMGTSLSVLFAKSIDFILYYNKRIMRDHATYVFCSIQFCSQIAEVRSLYL